MKDEEKKTDKLSFYPNLFVIITLLVNQSLRMQRVSLLLLLLLLFCTRSLSYLRLVKEVKTGRPIRKRIVLSCTSFQPFYFVRSISQFIPCHVTNLFYTRKNLWNYEYSHSVFLIGTDLLHKPKQQILLLLLYKPAKRQTQSTRRSAIFIALTFENMNGIFFFYEILILIKSKNINICCFF